MTKQRKLAYLALISTAVIWGIAPPVIKSTLNFISPLTFLFYRFLVAFSIVSIPFFLTFHKQSRLIGKDLKLYLILGGVLVPLNLILLFSGLNKTSAIDASLISIISPILIILGGALWLKEQVTKIEKVGIFLALSGTVVTVIQPFFENEINSNSNIEGNLLVLAGTFVWVLFTLLTKKNKQLNPVLLIGFSFFFGCLITLPFLVTEKIPFNSSALPGIIFMAVFCSVIAYFLYLFGLKKIEASEATVFTYLQPVFSVPLSVIFLNEKITLPFIIGAVFILAGVFICEYLSKLRIASKAG